MANPVDVIIGSEAIKQVQELKSQFESVLSIMVQSSNEAVKLGKNISGISTPKGFNDSATNNAKLSQELERQNKVIISLTNQIQRLSEIKKAKNQTDAIEVVNQRILNQNALTEAKSVSNLVGAYQKLDLEHKKALKSAQDIGAQYGITSDKFIKASQKANELDKQLKDIDSSLGKNNRNVGNYASGWNALGNSINQLTREAPAFANSLNTGFMAISNNIPVLTDAIKGLREQNKLLAAEGKPTVSILKQLASSIFSWQTLISVGVTLLTIYGAKIIDTITGSKAKKEALEKEKKALEEKTKAEERDRDVIASKQAEEITRSALLFEKAKNLTLSYSERSKAVKELKDRYPDYLRGLSDEEILAGNTAAAEEKLNDALINRGFALAAQEKIQENIKQELDLRLKYEKISLKALEIRNKEAQQSQELIVYTNKEDAAKRQKAENEKKQILEQDSLYQTKLSNLRAERASLISVFDENSKYISSVKETVKEDKKATKEKTNKIEDLNLEAKAIGTTIEQLDKYIDALQTELILNAGNEEAYKNIKIALEQVKKAKFDLMTGGGEILSTANIKEVSTAVEEVSTSLSKLQEQYLQSFTSEFFQNSGFSETFKLLNDEVDGFGENFAVTFNAIAESAQEAFNFISGISQQRFDAERDRLQNQYDIAIGFANGNKAAEEKLALDLEKRKKDIANRENKAKQKQAIFNIAIDTAQAVVAALPNIPLSIIIAALGAAQIGIVAAQKIPQYAEGTDNHSGGLMLVNDAKGSSYQEKVIFPNGKEFMPQGRNVLMDAPAGTKVLTPEQQLMEALNGTNIKLSKETINRTQGMTAEQMDYVLGKHFSNITTNTTIFDENGMRTWSERNGNKTIQTSNRVTRTGIRV